MTRRATLRVCASCEWIFKGGVGCPRCQFGSYGARSVYGDRAYTYARTQEPWFNRQMAAKASELHRIIEESRRGAAALAYNLIFEQVQKNARTLTEAQVAELWPRLREAPLVDEANVGTHCYDVTHVLDGVRYKCTFEWSQKAEELPLEVERLG